MCPGRLRWEVDQALLESRGRLGASHRGFAQGLSRRGGYDDATPASMVSGDVETGESISMPDMIAR